HRDGGGRAPAGPAPGGSAHRSRRDRPAPRRGRILRDRRDGARRHARAVGGGARSPPPAGAARGGARGAPRRPRRPRPAAAAGLADELEKRANIAAELAQAARALRKLDPALARELNAALAEELPHLKRDGGFVRAGYDAALDEVRALRDESRRVIAALQAR